MRKKVLAKKMDANQIFLSYIGAPPLVATLYLGQRQLHGFPSHIITWKPTHTKCVLCRAMFTCGDSTAGRGEDIRQWQFADLFMLPYDDQKDMVGPCKFCPLYVLRHEGKVAPRTDRPEYQAMVRARDPLVCPVGNLALYLFTRQYLGAHEAPPNVLKGKRHWYVNSLLGFGTCLFAPK